MAIVGTAYVRLRVIGDTLKKDLTKSVKDAVTQGKPDIENAGKSVGEEMSHGISEKISTDAKTEMKHVADDIGNALGDAMGKNMNRGLGVRLLATLGNIWAGLKRVSSNGVHALGDIFRGFGSIFKKAEHDADDGGGGLGGFFKNWWSNAQSEFSSGSKKIADSFKGFKDNLKKQTKDLGLSDFLIPGIAGLVTFLPGALSGATAIIGSFVGWAITALASIGPALAGGALAGVAAMGSLKLSMGLLKLALTGTNPEVKAFQKNWQAMREQLAKPIQSTLFPGLNGALGSLKSALPAITPELKGFGTAAGGVAQNLAKMISSGDGLTHLKSILATNNVFVTQAGAGLTGLAHAFLILFDHLKPVIEYLGSGIKALGDWSLSAIKGAEASGKLDGFIHKMFSSLTYFVGILVDFGKGIFNVFRAASGASGGMLQNLQGIASRFKEWTGSQAGQAKMLDFFTKARALTDQLLGMFSQLTRAGGKALGGFSFAGVSSGLEALAGMGKAIGGIFNAIKAGSKGAGSELLQNLEKVLTQLAQSGVIGILTKAFSNFFLILSKILAIPGVPQLLALVAGFAVMAKTFGLLSTAVKILLPGFKLLFTVIRVAVAVLGGPVTAILALVAALVWFFTQTKIGRQIIAEAWAAIKKAISAAIDGITIAFHAVVHALSVAWNAIVGAAKAVGRALSTAWTAVKNGLITAWNAIKNAVMTAVNAVWNVIKTVFNAIWHFLEPIVHVYITIFKTAFNIIKTVIETALNIIYQIWIRVFPILLLPLRIFEGLVILAWDAIKTGVTAAVKFISDVVTTVWNAIWGFLQPIIKAIWDFIVGAWNAISTAVTTAVQAVWDFIQTVWNAIWGFIVTVVTAIFNFYVAIWTAIFQAIWTALQAIWNVIVSIWNAVFGFIKGVLTSIGNTISGVWNAVVGWVSGAMSSIWSTIKSVWNQIIGFIQGAASTISGIWSGIWNGLKNVGSDIISGLKSAVNFFIGIVNTAIGGLNKMIGLANKLPGIDIPLIPTIPKLAKGGVVSPAGGGTLAMIAEAGRPERVEPLDENGLSKRDKAILHTLSAASGDTHVRVFIGDQELTQIVSTTVEKKNKNLASKLATGRKG